MLACVLACVIDLGEPIHPALYSDKEDRVTARIAFAVLRKEGAGPINPELVVHIIGRELLS